MKCAVFVLDSINKCSSLFILDKKVRYIGNKDKLMVEWKKPQRIFTPLLKQEVCLPVQVLKRQ